MPYVNHRWLGGMLTNFNTVKQSIKRLKIIRRRFHKRESRANKKRATASKSREIEKLNNSSGWYKRYENYT